MNLGRRRTIVKERTANPPIPAVVPVEPVKKSNRKMCPKCGVMPNYFFHVRDCKGRQ